MIMEHPLLKLARRVPISEVAGTATHTDTAEEVTDKSKNTPMFGTQTFTESSEDTDDDKKRGIFMATETYTATYIEDTDSDHQR